MTNVRWIIADPHFGHEAILRYEDRPYPNIEAHDEAIITNWNAVVKKSHEVYVLGDFALTNSTRMKEILKRLKGTKFLIRGNHDRKSGAWYEANGFRRVYPFPILMDKWYWLSHEPLYLNKHMPYVNIHGHIHSAKLESEQHINVSVEHINYTPILLDGIVTTLQLMANINKDE